MAFRPLYPSSIGRGRGDGERIPLQVIVAGAHAHEEGPVAQVIIDYFSSSLMRTTTVDILPPFPRAGRTPRSACIPRAPGQT